MVSEQIVITIIGAAVTLISGVFGVYQYSLNLKYKKEKDIAEDHKDKLEGESKAEELYVKHVEKTLDRYEKQMIQMEKEFNRRMEETEERFNKKIDNLEKKLSEKDEENNFLNLQIEKKDNEIDRLNGIIEQKDDLIHGLKNTLKGEMNNGKFNE